MVTLVVLLLVLVPALLYGLGWAVNKYLGTRLDRSPVATKPAPSIAKVETHADSEFEMQP